MFCPKCRYEYKEGITVCPDCNVPLVEQLNSGTGAAMKPDETWVPVCGVGSEVKAEMAKGALDSNNIPSTLISRSFGAYGHGMDFDQGLAMQDGDANIILVPREYREKATVILEGVLGDDFIDIEGNEE